MNKEIQYKFHLKSQTELVGLTVELNNATKKYDLADEIKMMRLAHDTDCSILFSRLEFVNTPGFFKYFMDFDDCHVSVQYNEKDDNYLVLFVGQAKFFGLVYDKYLKELLPDKSTYLEIDDVLYQIKPHKDGFLVINASAEESVGYLTPRKYHLILLESHLEETKEYNILYINASWVLDLIPRKEVK